MISVSVEDKAGMKATGRRGWDRRAGPRVQEHRQRIAAAGLHWGREEGEEAGGGEQGKACLRSSPDTKPTPQVPRIGNLTLTIESAEH